MSQAFRITQRSVSERTLVGLQSNLARLGKVQEQLSSGKLIQRPSDSPTGTVSAMQFRSDLRVNEQWGRNADDALGWLGTIDSTLSSSLTTMRRVRDLTVQGLNTGANSALDRNAIAAEIDGLRDTLLGQANATYLDRPVFGGTTASSKAFDASGTFIGDSNRVERTAGAGGPVRVDANGADVFGTGANSLFGVLESISAKLRGDPSTLDADLSALDGHLLNVTSKLSDVGTRYGRMEALKQDASDRVIEMRGSLSAVEDIDLPATIVELQLAETAYQAALGATAKVITPSLMDFLK